MRDSGVAADDRAGGQQHTHVMERWFRDRHVVALVRRAAGARTWEGGSGLAGWQARLVLARTGHMVTAHSYRGPLGFTQWPVVHRMH